MATIVEYNGVTMRNVVTRDWVEEIRYDQSDSDKIYKKVHLSWEGLVHLQADASVGVAGPVSVTNAAEQFRIVAALLSEPRRTLTVIVGGDLLLHVTGQGLGGCAQTYSETQYNLKQPDRDLNNGPHPRNVRLSHVCNNTLFKVVFEIEVAIGNCTFANGEPNLVLNNRWSLSEAMDRNFYVTRTLSGRLVASTSVVPLHAYKAMTVPTLEPGFARESIQFDSAANGLEADYTVVDAQVKWAAPAPASAISGAHTLITADGVTMGVRFALKLEAPPHVDTSELLRLAFNILDARTNFVRKIGGGKYEEPSAVLKSFQITEYLGKDNVLEMSADVEEFPEKAVEFLSNLSANVFGKPFDLPDYDPQISPVPALYGYQPWVGTARTPQLLLQLHARFQDPCCGPALPKPTPTGIPTPPGPNAYPEPKPPKTQIRESKSLPEKKPNKFALNVNKAIYTIARVSNSYSDKRMMVQLPMAAPSVADATTDKDKRDTSAFFKLAAGQCQRTVRFELERNGKAPKIPPAPEEVTDPVNGITMHLLAKVVDHAGPHLTPDAKQLVYHAAGEYVYGLSRPPSDTDKLQMGVSPLLSFAEDSPSVVFDPAVVYEKTATA